MTNADSIRNRQQKLQHNIAKGRERGAARREKEQASYQYNVLVQGIINKKAQNKAKLNALATKYDKELTVAKKRAKATGNPEHKKEAKELAKHNAFEYAKTRYALKAEYKAVKKANREKQSEISLLRTAIFPY